MEHKTLHFNLFMPYRANLQHKQLIFNLIKQCRAKPIHLHTHTETANDGVLQQYHSFSLAGQPAHAQSIQINTALSYSGGEIGSFSLLISGWLKKCHVDSQMEVSVIILTWQPTKQHWTDRY